MVIIIIKKNSATYLQTVLSYFISFCNYLKTILGSPVQAVRKQDSFDENGTIGFLRVIYNRTPMKRYNTPVYNGSMHMCQAQ